MPGPTGGFFSAILNVLLDDAGKAFNSGVLGRAVAHMTRGPNAPAGVAAAAQAATTGPPAQAGQNVWKPGMGQDPIPVLKQILGVLESLARRVGILPRAAAGAPAGPGPVKQLTEFGQRLFQPRHEVTQNTAGSAGYRFKQMAQQLAGKPFFQTFKPAAGGGAAAAGGTAARALMVLGRVAGVFGIVASVAGLAASVLSKFVAGVVDSNRELFRYNAILAGSFAKLDITQMQLNMRQAEAVAPGAVDLNEAVGNLMQEFQPIRQGIGIISNKIALVATNTGRGVVSLLKSQAFIGVIAGAFPMLGAIADAAKKYFDEEDKKNKALGAAMTGDLRALMDAGNGIAGFGAAGGRINKPAAPAFLPPLVRPGGPPPRQNPGGK